MLQRWGLAVTRHPKTTLLSCLLLAVASIAFTMYGLEFRSDRSELVDPALSWNRRFLEYKENFSRWDSLLVCFGPEESDPPLDELTRVIAERLELDDRITAADAGFFESQADPRLFILAPEAEFTTILERLRVGRKIASAEHANHALTLALSRLASENDGPGTLDELRLLLDPYLGALRGEAIDFKFVEPAHSNWRPLTSASGLLYFIQVEFTSAGNGLAGVSDNLHWLRGKVAEILRERGIDELDWGVTGIPAIEADETVQSIRDSTLASVVAFIAITVLMLVVFRGITVPLLAAGSLLIGMSWSFGWLMLTVGHLQLLSVVFSVILLGLGIDFALHLVSRLELVQDEHTDLPSAIARVYRGIGPGMITGAVTTAAAMFATGFTKFKGMAEMGIIAGGGILLCLIAMLCVFPAALALTGRWKRIIRHRPGGEEAHFAHGRLDVVDRHPRSTLMAVAVMIILLLLAARDVSYDPNVLNLHPPGIESVQWEKRLVEDDARSIWSALISTTAAKAPTLTRRLRELDTVSSVGGMGILFPQDLEARRRLVDSLRRDVLPSVSVAPGMATLRTQLATVRLGLAQRRDSESAATVAQLQDVLDDIDAALQTSRTFDAATGELHFETLNASFLTARSDLADQLQRALTTDPIEASDLPEFLRAQWIGEDGAWLLRVYPRADEQGRSILHPDRLGAFVESIRNIEPNVIGPPVQIYESTILIIDSYIQAVIYALLAIFILLLLDFRSLADSVCSMIPVAIGFLGMFALMSLSGTSLNFANIIAMPMIFGIGVDSGVHMVHRWRVEPYGRPAGLSGATGRGITLTMLTTMIGFGCMMLAEHRGIRSLGIAMLAGLGVTLLACYVVLPPLLRLRTPPQVEESG